MRVPFTFIFLHQNIFNTICAFYLNFYFSRLVALLSFCSYYFHLVILLLAAILPLLSMCMWKSMLFLGTQIIMYCLLVLVPVLVPLLFVVFLTYIIRVMLIQSICRDTMQQQITILRCLHSKIVDCDG